MLPMPALDRPDSELDCKCAALEADALSALSTLTQSLSNVKSHPGVFAVIIMGTNITSKSEVCDLHHIITGHKHIAGC